MFKIDIHTQPDDETCGPTSLHAIYSFYQDPITLSSVIEEVDRSESGGTLAPLLGKHALLRGYQAHIFAYNLDVFDPSWFKPRKLKNNQLAKKLEDQLEHKSSSRIVESSRAYQAFLNLGGELHFKDLTVGLLKHFFSMDVPILTGLSATYLYQSRREAELPDGQLEYDDLKGHPCGHFVVLSGYDEMKRHIVVADPHRENPLSHDNYYKVNVSRLINAIMLGVLTHDANLLIVLPKEKAKEVF